MRNVLIISALLTLLAGCVSKSEAQRQAREAFMAGQQQASAAANAKNQEATVSFRGDFAKETIPWTEGLTLAEAIVAADYQSLAEPRRIVITRGGRTIQVKPHDLERMKQITLEPGDVIEVGQ